MEVALEAEVAFAFAKRRIGIGGRAPSGVAQKQKPFGMGLQPLQQEIMKKGARLCLCLEQCLYL
jgi:hypothetical protein